MYPNSDLGSGATRSVPTRSVPARSRSIRLCALTLGLGLTAPAWALPQLVAAMDTDGGSIHVINATGVGSIIEPYGTSFSGGVRVAVGDVNGDGTADIITGSGAGIVAAVRIYDGVSLQTSGTIEPYATGFSGGVYVAAGDVNGDGRADIIVGSGPGGGGVVRVYDGRTLTELRTFTAYSGFNGGVHVAAGDVNGDGRDDIIVGSGAGGGPHVKVFDGRTGAVLHDFQAFDIGYSGGVHVAAGDFSGDGIADLVVGSGAGSTAGGGPRVKVFDGNNLSVLAEFSPYDPAFTGGVRVATGDLNGDGLADIITAPGIGGAPQLTRWLAPRATESGEMLVFSPNYLGGVFVAASVVIPTIMRDGFD